MDLHNLVSTETVPELLPRLLGSTLWTVSLLARLKHSFRVLDLEASSDNEYHIRQYCN